MAKIVNCTECLKNKLYKIYKKTLAFTLAETLIVMGNDAYGRATAVYGPMDEWGFTSGDYEANAKKAGDRITEFMKISKNCGIEKNKGCFTNGSMKFNNGNNFSSDFDTSSTKYKFILSDGTAIILAGDNVGKSFSIYIDIDGPNKGAYILGKDVFVFYLRTDNEQGIIPGTTAQYPSDSEVLNDCKTKGLNCSIWIIEKGNMDYLKCPNKLSETVTSCN